MPTVKLATNSPLAEKKPHWSDFNAGRLLEGMSMDTLLEDFVDTIVAIASGELTIFKSGVTL